MEQAYIIASVAFALIIAICIICSLWIDSEIVTTYCPPPDTSKGAAIGFYYLPESQFQLNAYTKIAIGLSDTNEIVEEQLLERRYDLTTTTVADTSKTFCLYQNTQPFFHDEVDFQVNEKGLLENMKVVMEDKTPQIFNSFLQEFTPKSSIKGDFIEALLPLPKPVRYEVYEFTKYVELPAWPTTNEATPVPWNVTLYPLNGGCIHHKVDLGFKISTTVEGHQSSPQQTSYKGLLFRPKVTATVTIEDKKASATFKKTVELFNKEQIIVVPLLRKRFVKRTQELTIQNGQLLAHRIVTPSSVEGFVNIPVDILRALVAIPAQLVRFRIDVTSAKRELEVQKGLLEREITQNKEAQNREMQQVQEKSQITIEQERIKYEAQLLKASNALAQVKKDASIEIERLQREIKNAKT